MFRAIAAFAICSLLLACSDSNDSFNPNPAEPPEPPEPEPTFSAEIVMTEFGIPHVTADDWGSLGYGYGYAYATQNYCVAMKEFVRSAGESARYLGDEADLNEDLVMKLYNDDERIQRIWIDAMSDRVISLGEGFVAGLNRYLRDTGVENLAEGEEGCRDAEWVREVDMLDLGKLLHRRILRGSALALTDFIVAAQPPETVAANLLPTGHSFDPNALQLPEPAEMRSLLGLPPPEVMGSNAYAVGAEAVQGGGTGLLFGNPHFPWQGPDRFYMSHLTIPGVYDVMGSSLHGIPGVVIGFNQNLAWSHTVSTGDRFAFYELTLNPENPLEYEYDGEFRALEAVPVSAETVNDSGEVETVDHTFYLTHNGAAVDLGGLDPLLAGWPNILGTLVTYRDANLENLRGMEQWLNMGQSTNMEEFKAALVDIGTPWVNTIAADRFGDAFYGDISTVPHITQQLQDNCVRGFLQSELTLAGFITLDGADSACEWGSDEGAPEGVFGYDSLPKLENREYSANANDSYWLSNPRELLTGFPDVIGLEDIEQSQRTRLTFVQAEQRLDGSDDLGDPLFTNQLVRDIHYSARNYPAELILADVVADCSTVADWSAYSSSPDSVAEACAILGGWDTRHTIDSTGGHIFYEFWLEVRGLDKLWAAPFDPTDPVNTPNTLNTGDADVMEGIRQGLADSVQVLLDNGIALDLPWGEVQYDERNGVNLPIHGGSGSMLHSAISSDLVDGQGYADITSGNSYIQAVSWDETDCPDANAILTYSQSTDPTSDHYADATTLYSESGWIDMPFCEADRDAQEISRMTIEE
jgi:acyl-homoserine-lactone acylase